MITIKEKALAIIRSTCKTYELRIFADDVEDNNTFRFELIHLKKCPHCHMVDTTLLDASSGYYPTEKMIVEMISDCDTMVKLDEEDIANFNKAFL